MSTSAALTGPATATSGDSTFTITVNLTYPAAAVQLPFSDPAAVANGTVQITSNASSPQPMNGSVTVSSACWS